MRRKDRETSQEMAYEILDHCPFMTLSTVNEDGSPYGIGIALVREGNILYFHCARLGQKVDNLNREPRVCLSGVSYMKQYPQKYATLYDSVVVKGLAKEVCEEQEKFHALRLICEKYASTHMSGFDNEIKASFKATAIYKINIVEISGKSSQYSEDGKPVRPTKRQGI